MSSSDHKKTPAAWMRNLLLGSVAVNVFLAGFLFANVLKPSDPATVVNPPAVTLGGLPPDLPPELREKFENNFVAHRDDIQDKYREIYRTRLHLQDLMESANFNEHEVHEALEEIRGLQIDIQGSIHETMVETLRDLDPDMRIMLLRGSTGDLERGIWSQRKIDGARWKVDVENGEIVFDLYGIDKDENGEPDGFHFEFHEKEKDESEGSGN